MSRNLKCTLLLRRKARNKIKIGIQKSGILFEGYVYPASLSVHHGQIKRGVRTFSSGSKLRIGGMSQALYQAFNNFWESDARNARGNGIAKVRRTRSKPLENVLALVGYMGSARLASCSWQCNCGTLAISVCAEFETRALEPQKQALLNPSSLTADQLMALDRATKAQAAADQSLASYYCSRASTPKPQDGISYAGSHYYKSTI